ncbi:two component, sigma54 specific, transcriptional regulator, Fis family [Geoalkalibacter ferrihydriticus]|uniref:DNA-binding transcriptional regulator NtrC n=2 Tax=Geoalkalibacter ferrihydriticus TaxID=392333 RepID=A0A0C2HU61_9BACT|nr:sigma-54 dependent transcriptional regulator [Geoalkalibacter ferrihydriticus]KIH76372.1 chemotaxis protein CheY [Geoalkalibacter ferrihydriticus DSM 17813]SDL91280.1 two component, sigma54 specific, transcriptional regulator, Fis family [Geoalkalibacter ferrihydriticus]
MGRHIYICDDEAGILRYLQKMLLSQGYEVEVFSSPLRLLRHLEEGAAEEPAGLLLLDMKMPELDGIDTLRRVRELRPQLMVVMMTGHGTIDSAVEAMKLGAYDYLSKPFPQEKLFTLVRHCFEREQLIEENRQLRSELKNQVDPGTIIAESPAFRKVIDLAVRVAATDSNVLILGESGTGKEVVARAVHRASHRNEQRFLAVNCAALAETLLESQLFGHVRGAFTGAGQNQKGILEEAHGGTLFLDEIGDVSPALQAKLLRVLQEGEFIAVGATRPKRVNVRFIAATNKDLEKEVAAGRFREDLFYRLNVIGLSLPPLRERSEDIEPLALHFLSKMIPKTGSSVRRIDAEALAALRAYAWPGNVRELENVIERGTILADGEVMTPEALPLKLTGCARPPVAEDGPLPLREAERRQIVLALRETVWNKSQAAILLGITRKTLDRKIKEFDLSPAAAGDLS